MILIDGKEWFNQDKDKFRCRRLAPPFDDIFVGTDPLDGMTLETASSFDAFINMYENANYSEDDIRPRPDTRYYHFPIYELGYWGYTPFFRSKEVLDAEYGIGSKVYLHCAAGAGRSPSIAMGWLMSRGYDIWDASGILNNYDSDRINFNVNKFRNLQRQKHIPKRLDEMYRLQNKGLSLESTLKSLGVIR